MFCEGEKAHYNMQLLSCDFRTGTGVTASYQITVNKNVAKEYPLTLTEKYVFWKIPESSLYHVEVTTAHTVHKGWQEVRCQATAEKTYTIT